MTYIPGKVRAICDRCGFEYPLSALKKEWTGLMVCSADYDVRPPDLSSPRISAEGVPKTNARPDSQEETANTTTSGDL